MPKPVSSPVSGRVGMLHAFFSSGGTWATCWGASGWDGVLLSTARGQEGGNRPPPWSLVGPFVGLLKKTTTELLFDLRSFCS